jgi:hypothetical protein
MLGPESLQIKSYLFANKSAQSAPESLAERRACFDVMVEKYAGHPIPCHRNHQVQGISQRTDIDGQT